jgi:hypothetical protein
MPLCDAGSVGKSIFSIQGVHFVMRAQRVGSHDRKSEPSMERRLRAGLTNLPHKKLMFKNPKNYVGQIEGSDTGNELWLMI